MDEIPVKPDYTAKASSMALQMIENLPPNLRDRYFHAEKAHLSKRQRQELLTTIVLGAMESPEFLQRICEEALAKPLEFLKQQVALIPKTAEVQLDSIVRHVIVVPEAVAMEHWNKTIEEQAQDTISWSDDLTGTGFGD
jgi:diphthamide synthase (EF-2-diphthine--ammonia ligase)